MARFRSSCPPGVFCISAGLITTVCILLSVFAVFVAMGIVVTSRSPISLAPSSATSAVPSSPVMISMNGGDSRYDRAPQPLRDWMSAPEFPPRGGLSSLPFNQPTKGLPESFQSIGTISVGDKLLPLYGRRTAGSSDRWNYYTRTDSYNPIPLPIRAHKRDCMDDIGCPEIFSGDNVHVSGLQKEGKTEIYRFDGPKYIPGLL